jgi:hypothetical protein
MLGVASTVIVYQTLRGTQALVCCHGSPGRTSSHRINSPGIRGPQRTMPCKSASSAAGTRSCIQSVTATPNHERLILRLTCLSR